MRSYWMQMTGTEAALEQRDTPRPEPGPGQLLVRMRAAALNRGEFLPGHGVAGKPGAWKAIGNEGAGEVLAAGDGAGGFRPGDRVMGRCAGAFAECALMEASEAMRMPESLSWEEAAAIPLTYLVAFDMLVLKGHLAAGEWLLVNGASSGVGVASLQLGRLLGARTLGTSGAADKLERLAALGLDVAIRTRGADFAQAVLDATNGRGADLAINAVGGSTFAENLRALAFEGRLATVGFVDGVTHGDIDLGAVHSKRLTIFGVSNRLRTTAQRAAAVPRFVAEILPRFADRTLRPSIDRVYEFSDLPAAKARMDAGAHIGKLVLQMPDAPRG